MFHGVAVLVILVYFIIVAIFLTILWRISSSLDIITRSLADIARDLKRLADKSEK
jgi:uncharacterized protein YoxC